MGFYLLYVDGAVVCSQCDPQLEVLWKQCVCSRILFVHFILVELFEKYLMALRFSGHL